MVLALPQLVRQAQLKAAKGRTPRWLERRELPQPRRLTVELQLVLVLALALCLGRATVAAAQAEPAERAWLDWRLAAPVRAAALARALTLDEKAAQLTSASPRLDRLGVPAYHWRNNVLHGVVDNGVSTVFPQAIALGATWDAELLQRSGLAWGLEQRSKYNAARRRAAGPPGSELRDSPMNFGLDLWGPNINMFVHPLWGRGQETYGEDPVLSGTLAGALVRGLQRVRSGVPLSAASPKHFDAYTIEREPDRLRIYEAIPESQLASYYFPAFRAVVRAGCAMIMCSYNGINATWKGQFSSAPMCASPLLESALRADFGFSGTVVTDSGAVDFMVERFRRFSTKAEAAAAAISAGADLESGSAYLELPEAVRRGLVSEAVLDRALVRVLSTRIRLGQLDPASRDPWRGVPETVANSGAHRALAFEAALGSLVLLRNPSGLLPLDVDARHRRVAVVGPAANDTLRQVGSYHGCHFDTLGALLPECALRSPVQAVREAFEPRGASVALAAGCSQHGGEGPEEAEALLAEAERLARGSDVVLAFVGLRDCTYEPGAGCEGEDRDRDDLALPGRQAQLLARLYATGVPLVVVLSGGGPLAPEVDKIPNAAVLAAWYGGREGPDAVAAVLAGARQPSGKLPVTFYNGLAQVAPPLGMDLRDAPGRTYRYLEPVPLWAFGYGLAYTTVEYSDASVNGERRLSTVAPDAKDVRLCVSLTNRGPFAQPCDETLMVFAAPPALPASAPLQPKLVLLAFTKVKALRLGERRQVCLDVALEAAKLPPGDRESSALELLPGTYALSVGGRKPGPIGLHEPPNSVPEPLLLALRVASAAASAA